MSDLGDFRRRCHDAARATGGTVTGFHIAEQATPNFHQAAIEYRDRMVAVVMARDAPILAVAQPRAIDAATATSSGPLAFVDEPGLIAALADPPGFRVLTLADLGRPFDAAEWPHLHPSDIRYWRPTTVGEALFNYWD